MSSIYTILSGFFPLYLFNELSVAGLFHYLLHEEGKEGFSFIAYKELKEYRHTTFQKNKQNKP